MTTSAAALAAEGKAAIRAPLKSPDPKNRINTVVDIVELWSHAFSRLLLESQKDPEQRAAMIRWLDEDVIANVVRLDDVLSAFHKPAGAPLPVDLEQRIAAAFAAVARAQRGILLDVDGLFALTYTYADPADQQLVASLGALKLIGRVRLPEVQAELLKRHNVLAICVDRDPGVRLIDLVWLTSHAAIYRHVTSGHAGPACRFCRIREPGPGRVLMVAANQSERTSGMTLDANDRRIDLNAATGYVHRGKCLERWNQWVAIAKQYASEEEAAAADRKAGRAAEEVAPPPEPAVAPELEPAPEPQERRDYYDAAQATPPAERRSTGTEIHDRMLTRRRARKGLDDGN